MVEYYICISKDCYLQHIKISTNQQGKWGQSKIKMGNRVEWGLQKKEYPSVFLYPQVISHQKNWKLNHNSKSLNMQVCV